MSKIKTIEHGAHIYSIAQSDTNRAKQLINDIHCWLIKKLVGKKPVIMNVRFADGRVEASKGALVSGCIFELDGPRFSLELDDAQ